MRTLTVILALCAACVVAEKTSPLEAVSQSTEKFSNNLFKMIASKNENLISSPLSAHIVLSQVALGAAGNTAKQMYQALHLPSNNALIRSGFPDLISQLNNVKNVTLEVANKLYVAQGMKLNSEYQKLSRDSFSSEAAELDVNNGPKSAKLVNEWVDKKTHHKISKIVDDSDIDSDTRILLLNAIYFKGKWAQKFDEKETLNLPFLLNEDIKKRVPTMFKSGTFVYGELPELQAKFVELPYENKDMKMVIVVPNEIDGLSNLLENLDSLNSARLASAGHETEVHVYLPKFKIESTIELEQALEKLGMIDMFSSAANFYGISDEPLEVSKVRQKAYIEVNEEGSEAAAVTETGLDFRFGDDYDVINANRPFYFVISKGSLNLFSGVVVDPIVA